MTSPSGSGYVIENCQTLERYNVVFDTTASITLGSSFRTNYPNRRNCYSVLSTLTDFEDWDLVNLPILKDYEDCEECLGDILPFTASFLVVAGGGGAGTDNGGGGGAGGLLSGTFDIDPFNNYVFVVGAGGVSGVEPAAGTGTNGSNSQIIINSTDFSVSVGGGGGGSNPFSGSNGGSGGGAGGFVTPGQPLYISGGLGIVGQGFDGGDSDFPQLGFHNAAGGGGASEEGKDAFLTPGGNNKGGNGLSWLDGLYYAGGGGGVGSFTFPERRYGGTGGIGGGGTGNVHEFAPANIVQYGERNTGGGAGGVGFVNETYSNGANGGSGVIKIRYEGPNIKLTGGFVSQSNGFIYHTFTNTTTIDLGQVIYPNGYVVKECTTGQVLKMAWDDTSSIQLNNTLLIDTQELEGCFTISQSVQLNETEWDYINIPFTSYDICDDCITGSFVYTASVLDHCLFDYTASAWYDRNVNLQPGQVWSFARTVAQVDCYTVTSDKVLSNVALQPGTDTQVFDYFNQGGDTGGDITFAWTIPTQYSDCETCISGAMFITGAYLENCVSGELSTAAYSNRRTFLPIGKVYRLGQFQEDCYLVSSSYYNVSQSFDYLDNFLTGSYYRIYDSCEECLARWQNGFRFKSCDDDSVVSVFFNDTSSVDLGLYYNFENATSTCYFYSESIGLPSGAFELNNPTILQSYNTCQDCIDAGPVTASRLERCDNQQIEYFGITNYQGLTLSSSIRLDNELTCYTYLGEEVVTVGQVEAFGTTITDYYVDCVDCANGLTGSLWIVSQSGVDTSGINFTDIGWRDINGNPQTASFYNSTFPQVNTMYVISAEIPTQLGNFTKSNIFVGPYSPGSGSAFTIEVIAGGGATSEGSNFNYLFTGSYAFSYKDENGITQNTTIASGSTQQFCVTEVSQSFNLVRQLPLFPAPITVYYNPFQITKIQDNCL